MCTLEDTWKTCFIFICTITLQFWGVWHQEIHFLLYLYLFLISSTSSFSFHLSHFIDLSNCAKWVLCIYNCIFNMFYVISTLFMCANIQIVKCVYRSGNLIFKVQLFFKYLLIIIILLTPNIFPLSQNSVFFLYQVVLFDSMTDTAGHRTLHDDGSIFQTLIPCLQVPEGKKRTFHFPPANCLISCCRWRAQPTVREEERRPRLAQELAHTHFICLIYCNGSRLPFLSGAS